MNDISPVLIAGCGVLIVVLGLIMVGGYLMYRLLRVNIFGMAMGYFMRHNGDELEADPQVTAHTLNRSQDLRAKAEALDFDAAVARASKEKGMPLPLPPQETDLSAQGFKPADLPPSTNGSAPHRRRRKGVNEDEIFGGMLDDDGDGDIDF